MRLLQILVRVLAWIAIGVGIGGGVGSFAWHTHSVSGAPHLIEPFRPIGQLTLTRGGSGFNAVGRGGNPPGLPTQRRVLAASSVAGATVSQSSAARRCVALTPFLVRGPPLPI